MGKHPDVLGSLKEQSQISGLSFSIKISLTLLFFIKQCELGILIKDTFFLLDFLSFQIL